MPDLKPGTLCWLTKSHPENDGKIVEVKGFYGENPRWGDLYEVLSKTPLLCRNYYATGHIDGDIRTFKPGETLVAIRSQLIPINDPKLSMNLGIEAVQDQLKSLPLKEIP